jgi:hypothetical protein
MLSRIDATLRYSNLIGDPWPAESVIVFHARTVSIAI